MSSLTVSTIQTDNINSLTSGITALTIDSSGRTRMPNTPVFYGYRTNGTAGWENYGTTLTSAFIYNNAVTNRGNCYNTTTGTFTCPIEGVYAFCPGALIGNNANYATLYVFKNNINVTARGVHANTNGVSSNWFHSSTVFMIRCVKNDKMQIRCGTPNLATIYGQDGYAHCSIWLYS
jgi:hypothetical protein